MNSLLKRLKKISSSVKRAKVLHQEINKQMRPILDMQAVKKFSACRKGCAACCHTQVSVTRDEADLLALRVFQGIPINTFKLEAQASVGNDSKAWYQIDYDNRKCIFLNKENECMVYEDRPSVCRTNNVLLSNDNCSTKDGIERPIRLINTHMADMAMVAGYKVSEDNGALPKMLLEALDRRSKLKKHENTDSYDALSKKTISNNLPM